MLPPDGCSPPPPPPPPPPPIGPLLGCIVDIIAPPLLFCVITFIGFVGGFTLLLVLKSTSGSIVASTCVALIILFYIVVWTTGNNGIKVAISLIFSLISTAVAFLTFNSTHYTIAVPTLVIAFFSIYISIKEIKIDNKIKLTEKGLIYDILVVYMLMCGMLYFISAISSLVTMLFGLL